MVCIVQITDNEASLTQNRPICGSRGLRSVTGSLMFAGQGSGNCGGPKTLSSSVRFSFSTPVGQAPVHPPIMMVQQPQPPPPPPQQQTIIMGGAPAAEATGDCPICKKGMMSIYINPCAVIYVIILTLCTLVGALCILFFLKRRCSACHYSRSIVC
ncbi:uncharacterized protein LOC123504596 isoform X1 [Portunus trituberculatus]|uniref:Brain protein I3 n=1 Tax=Portunus trituberculatus TaxID=210409 RepID=A0A5B7JAN1_PORTR|nr:uncharacterized protein LOC123504596 isoform X1 [Portunus trituberculatus]MPC89454.1 hypothetical protein [Portunus trituberculatus]